MRPPALLIAVATAVALLLAPAGAAAAPCTATQAPPTADTVVPAIVATVCLANEERAAAGVAPLTLDMGLTAVAFGYARQMVAEHFYDHTAPDGQTLADRLAVIGYHPDAAGENMFWGVSETATPAAALDAWMHSDRHRMNLLDPRYRRIGVGIAMGTPGGATGAAATYVADFDSGQASPEPAPTLGPPADADVIAASPSRQVPRPVRGVRAAARARRAVKAWFEAARLGDGQGFCRLQDNRMLEATYGRPGPAGIAACVAAFQAVPGLPAASELRFTRVRARGTRAAMQVVARGRRVAFALRKFNGRWKLDSVSG